MRLLKSLLNIYVQASLHVAVAVTALSIIGFWAMDKTPEKDLLGFVFFTTVFAYNYIKISGTKNRNDIDSSFSIVWFRIINLIAIGSSLYFLIFLPIDVLSAFLLLGVVSLLYVFPFFRSKNLRSFAGIKIFIVGLVWAGVTVLVPMIYGDDQFYWDRWILFAQLFLMVIAWTIPFEIRDLRKDPVQLKTLPQLLGIRKAMNLGLLFVLIVVLMEFFKDELQLWFLLSLLVTAAASAYFLWKSMNKQSPYFASFWVEATPILWLGCCFLLKYYFESS